ncbi:hypothetical protein R6Q57_006188, partial [Mikania cordata]
RLSLKHGSSSGVPKTSRDDASNIPMDAASKVPMDDTSKVHMVDAPVNNESRSWVPRMMFIRGANKRKNPSPEFDLTILPPQFHSEMYDYKTKFGSEYANGMNELYPPFWEAIEDWVLVQINLCTMELTQYWYKHKYLKHYGRLIHYGILQKFDMFFDKLLDAVSYWRCVIHGPYKPQQKGYLKTQHINDDYLPKNWGGIDKDSGVFLCMLMQKLVHKKTLTVEGEGIPVESLEVVPVQEGFLVGQMVDAPVQEGFLVGQMLDAPVQEGFLVGQLGDTLAQWGFHQL